MKKYFLFAVSAAAAALLAGCSTPVPPAAAPAPEAVQAQAQTQEIQAAPQPMLLAPMQALADEIRQAGGLAAVGMAESQSLDLALNKAKVNGRQELAKIMAARVGALDRAFSVEAGLPEEALILSGFNNTVRFITEQQIAGSVAQTLKYEARGDIFTAYAIMVLDPGVIADQLAKEPELYARLKTSKAYDALSQEIKTYAAFKAAQK